MALERYGRLLRRETLLIDRLVAACYATRQCFPAFVAATMLYFTAVTSCERRLLAGESPGFLAADDVELSGRLSGLAQQLINARPGVCQWDDSSAQRELIARIREGIRPWNHIGLLDPCTRNMYHRTALPVG